MNKWIKEIPVWWFVHPTVEDVCAGRAKSQSEFVRKERKISCWSRDIKSMTSNMTQETDDDGKVKNVASYTISIDGYKHTFSISSASYIQLQEMLSKLS